MHNRVDQKWQKKIFFYFHTAWYSKICQYSGKTQCKNLKTIEPIFDLPQWQILNTFLGGFKKNLLFLQPILQQLQNDKVFGFQIFISSKML